MRFWSRVTSCFRDTWVITCRPRWRVTWPGGAARPTSGAPTATPPPSVTSGESKRGWAHRDERYLRNIGPSDLATPVLDDKGRKRLFFCGEVFKKRKKRTLVHTSNLMISICPIIEPWDATSGEDEKDWYLQASDTEHYGTVTGAMVSGCREGLRLANILASR